MIKTNHFSKHLNDCGLGKLINLETQEIINYQPYEVSQTCLGIISYSNLPQRAPMQLQIKNGTPLKFRVREKHAPLDSKNRYSLLCEDKDIDIEQIFLLTGCHKKFEMLTSSKIQSRRYLTNPPLNVLANTFGQNEKFHLITHNISKTGMLLKSSTSSKTPFITNTLLELHITNKGGWLTAPIKSLGKVKRLSQGCIKKYKDGNLFWGIEITEMPDSAELVWSQTIEMLSRKEV